MTFQPAVRRKARARIALQGPAGSGKTYTALRIASAWGGTIGLADTEHESALKYAAPPGGPTGPGRWEFLHQPMRTFSPDSLLRTVADAADAHVDNLIIDSFTHFWSGPEGLLEQVEKASKKTGGNTFGGWKEMRPVERRVLDALLNFPGHLILTMRSKTEYAIEEDGRGRKVPRKVGLKADQREGIDYEMDIVMELDLERVGTITKSRCSELAEAVIPKPGEDFAAAVLKWLEEGDDVLDVTQVRERAIEAAGDVQQLRQVYRLAEGLGLLPFPVKDVDGTAEMSLATFIRNLGQAAAGEAS